MDINDKDTNICVFYDLPTKKIPLVVLVFDKKEIKRISHFYLDEKLIILYDKPNSSVIVVYNGSVEYYKLAPILIYMANQKYLTELKNFNPIDVIKHLNLVQSSPSPYITSVGNNYIRFTDPVTYQDMYAHVLLMDGSIYIVIKTNILVCYLKENETGDLCFYDKNSNIVMTIEKDHPHFNDYLYIKSIYTTGNETHNMNLMDLEIVKDSDKTVKSLVSMIMEFNDEHNKHSVWIYQKNKKEIYSIAINDVPISKIEIGEDYIDFLSATKSVFKVTSKDKYYQDYLHIANSIDKEHTDVCLKK